MSIVATSEALCVGVAMDEEKKTVSTRFPRLSQARASFYLLVKEGCRRLARRYIFLAILLRLGRLSRQVVAFSILGKAASSLQCMFPFSDRDTSVLEGGIDHCF